MFTALFADIHRHDEIPFVPLLWFAVIVTVVFLVRLRRGSCMGWRSDARSSGEAVLAERYARGEIDRGELDARLHDLREVLG